MLLPVTKSALGNLASAIRLLWDVCALQPSFALSSTLHMVIMKANVRKGRRVRSGGLETACNEARREAPLRLSRTPYRHEREKAASVASRARARAVLGSALPCALPFLTSIAGPPSRFELPCTEEAAQVCGQGPPSM